MLAVIRVTLADIPAATNDQIASGLASNTPGHIAMDFRTPLFIAALIAVHAGRACGFETAMSPVVPGLDHKHPLSERQIGEVLIGELRCASCHEGMNGADMKAAPDLRQVGARLTSDYTRRFIADPAAQHAGTTMPSLLAAESDENRRTISESITHYLQSLQTSPSPLEKAPQADANAGRELFHSIGCVACHSPRDDAGKETPGAGDVSLAHIPGKYQPHALADFLFDPLKVRPSGRMPDMNLSKAEAAALASYLMGGASMPSSEPTRPTAREASAGKAAFEKFNCASCHQLDDPEPVVVRSGPPQGKLDPVRGCLSDHPKSAPDYHLGESQVAAIRAALTGTAAPRSVSDRIKVRLTQLNCIACHVRDDYGGVAAGRDAFFHSSEAALGNEARIPPPLTLIGAKLRAEWMNRVLYDREKVRPYMQTRMPQFGESALKELSAWFAEVDHLDPVEPRLLDADEMVDPDRGSIREMTNGAHQLLGDTGLSCIACHNFNGTESPGMKGLDLMTSYQRLQPAWFHRYMKNPAAFRPGIIMPSYWPGGKALQTGILDGDTELQLQALWHTFSLGRSARDPSGLRSPETKLAVTDKPLIHRGRSRIAGYRGIAVGFPGGMNYAFNAQNGALSALWHGEFINVNWKSQGAGDFTPVGKAVTLAQDVAFLRLEGDKALWPLLPVTSKEQPVNPDPLYPRKYGYAFVGYALDDTSIPTFTYRCGGVTIVDKSVPSPAAGTKGLQRTLSFSSATPETLYFRALTGRIESESPTVFKTPELRFGFGQGQAILRPAAGREGEQDLLIKLSIPKGTSALAVDYALLP